MRKSSKSEWGYLTSAIVLITVHATLLLVSLLTHTSHHLLVLHHWSLEIVLSHLKIQLESVTLSLRFYLAVSSHLTRIHILVVHMMLLLHPYVLLHLHLLLMLLLLHLKKRFFQPIRLSDTERISWTNIESEYM